MIKYVGFDKDGTLIDDFNGYTKEWGKVIQSDFGINSKDAEEVFINLSGEPTDIQLAEVLKNSNINLPSSKIFHKAEEIAEVLGNRVQGNPFPEVNQVLKRLKNEGYKIFVSSGQREDIVINDLYRTGLIQHVDFFTGINPDKPDYKKGKPHFRAAAQYFNVPFETFIKETVFIGDTPADFQLCNESNIICIIRKSIYTDDSLVDKGVKVINDFSTLPELIKAL